MNTNRRQFLKLTASVMAALTVPSAGLVPVTPLKEGVTPAPGTATNGHGAVFDPQCEYGDWLALPEWSDRGIDTARKALVDQISSCIPVRYRDKIEFIYKLPSANGCISGVGTVGWKYPGRAA